MRAELTILTMGIYTICVLWGFRLSYRTVYSQNADPRRFQEKRPTAKRYEKHLPRVLGNMAVLFLLAGIGVYVLAPWFSWEAPAPWVFAAQFFIYLVVDDVYFYGHHRLMHENRWLYKKVHARHHLVVNPIPVEFIYVHPIEWMIGFSGPALGGLFIFFAWGEINVWAFEAMVLFRTLHEIDIHSGCETPWHRFIPFMGTVRHHDDHHRFVKGNYASTFHFMDLIFGTDFPEGGPGKRGIVQADPDSAA